MPSIANPRYGQPKDPNLTSAQRGQLRLELARIVSDYDAMQARIEVEDLVVQLRAALPTIPPDRYNAGEVVALLGVMGHEVRG